MSSAGDQERGERWFERCLPFVARASEARLRWLVAAAERIGRERGGALAPEELAAYIRIFLGNESMRVNDYHRRGFSVPEEVAGLAPLFAGVAPETVTVLVRCADIYDVPDLFALICSPTVEQAEVALRKEPPAYEKNPARIVDRVFHAVFRKSPALLEEAAARISASADAPAGFAASHERFMEIVRDEEILGELFPRALQATVEGEKKTGLSGGRAGLL